MKQEVSALQEGYVTEGSIDAEQLNKHCSDHWWRGMKYDYKEFAKAIKKSNLEKCQELMDKGLNISGKLYNEELTAMEYAKNNQLTELEIILDKKSLTDQTIRIGFENALE